MQTDLARILSVSGQHGLFQYIAQARGGAIGESLETKQRKVFSASSRISTLADIAIYTSEGEMKLDQVFLALKEALGDAEAPSPKAPEAELVALFRKAIPNYDADRFYVSHMRKVVDWYSQIVKYASLDFVKEEELPMSRRRLRVVTLGCSKNTVDTEHLLAQLPADAFTVVDGDVPWMSCCSTPAASSAMPRRNP